MLPKLNGLASTIVVVVLLTSKYAAHACSTSASLGELKATSWPLVHIQAMSFLVRRLRGSLIMEKSLMNLAM